MEVLESNKVDVAMVRIVEVVEVVEVVVMCEIVEVVNGVKIDVEMVDFVAVKVNKNRMVVDGAVDSEAAIHPRK